MIHCTDFMDNGLPDGCASLIIVDPPYFEVKGGFDYAWPSFEAYLADVRRWAQECERLLAPNGTLYWWGHALKIAYTQVVLDQVLELQNSIIWEKHDCRQRATDFTRMRRCAPVTERLLMYARPEKGHCSGLEAIHSRPDCFRPIKDYLTAGRERARATLQGQNLGEYMLSLTGTRSMWKHYFTDHQWQLPTAAIYERMHASGHWPTPWEELRASYEELRASYEELRASYEELRRPWNTGLELLDVWRMGQDTHITRKYDHPTQKPLGLSRRIVQASSRPGELVVVPFAGSGTEMEAALLEGRHAVGFEIDPHYAAQANKRISTITPSLYATDCRPAYKPARGFPGRISPRPAAG